MYGYLIFALFFWLAGFRIYVFGLAICFGWEDEDVMIKGVVSSAIILTVYVILRLCGVSNYIIDPFASAIQVLGTNIVCMGLMIITSDWHYYRNEREAACNKFTLVNLGFALFLGLAMILGFVF